MRRTPTKKTRLWRWRHNPLRRRSDRVEAWIVLATWLVALAGGLLVGELAGASLEHSLADRRARAHPVAAVLTTAADGAPTVTEAGGGSDPVWVKARWTAPDGSARTGLVRAGPGSPAGTSVTVWTDRAGGLVPKPPTAAEARLQSTVAGVLVTVGTGAAVVGCGWLARARLDRRRMRDWDEEWARVGPQWRRKMTG